MAPPAAVRRKAAKAPAPLSLRVWLYLALLTLQYGVQPLLSKRFTGYSVPSLAAEIAN